MHVYSETFTDFHTGKVPTFVTSIELLNETCNISEDSHCCYDENFYDAGSLYMVNQSGFTIFKLVLFHYDVIGVSRVLHSSVE